MAVYIHQLEDWPAFHWDQSQLLPVLTHVRNKQGRLMGKMEAYGFQLREEASLETLTLEILKSSEIEGEHLNADQVRSSIARKLGLDIAALIPADRNVEGVVEMMLDATQNYKAPLTAKRLFGWNSSLFPTGKSGMNKIVTGAWRDNTKEDPMQVVSGPLARQTVHFEAPEAEKLSKEMKVFLKWFNTKDNSDPVLKAAIAHLWFVTIHPFDDGNGRIARAIADMQLARADDTSQRFYSMSAQIRRERKTYYDVLEQTQKGTLDITSWLQWFFNCLNSAITATDEVLAGVLQKAKFWEKHSSTSLNERQKLMVNKMLDGFEGKLNTSKWGKIAKCSPDTALRDIQDLINKNVLAKQNGGGRSTSYEIVYSMHHI